MVKPNNILNRFNFERLKNIDKAKLAHSLGKNPLLYIGGVCGLGLFLSSRAKNSKRQNQGGF